MERGENEGGGEREEGENEQAYMNRALYCFNFATASGATAT